MKPNFMKDQLELENYDQLRLFVFLLICNHFVKKTKQDSPLVGSQNIFGIVFSSSVQV